MKKAYIVSREDLLERYTDKYVKRITNFPYMKIPSSYKKDSAFYRWRDDSERLS